MSKFKRLAVLAVSALTLTVVAAPAYAGEDCSDDNTCRQAGGSDTGSASGGASTGFGGMAASNDGTTTAIGLAGGGVLILTAAGLVARRREIEVGV